jgi:Na+:H+ antiporter, NhaA family
MTIRIERPVGSGDHVLGPANAGATLVEYGDFECDYCARAFPIVKQVIERFPDDVRFVFRHSPQARLHPNAQLAAEASEAAGAQDKFWEFHDGLYTRRDPVTWERLLAEARGLGLDETRFVSDVESHRFRDIVTELERSGAHTVRGTPTFFLNGVRYEEASDFDSLASAIDTALKFHG